MENNKELQELINAFKGYRDVLGPIQINLHELVDTYASIEGDLVKLDSTLGGENKEKLNRIYDTLSSQAKKSSDLSSNIEQFLKSSNKYINDVNSIHTIFTELEKKLNEINELEAKTKEQIKKLDALIEEKKLNYNVKDLQKSLDNYNVNVQKISDFINKDVASVLTENTKKIDSIKKDSELLTKMVENESTSIDNLIRTFNATNELLTTTIQKEEVNEEYIFAILDKWANSRNVKIKK